MNAIGLHHFAALEPQAAAVTDQLGSTWTRGHLFAASSRLARALRARGLQPGDSLAIMAPNCVEYLQAFFAATQIGLYVVSLNWHLARPELTHILADSRARALVTHERVGAQARALLAATDAPPQVLLSVGTITGFENLETFCAQYPGEALVDPVPGRLMIYTSATTGRPKGIELPLADTQAALERVVQAHVRNGIRPGGDNVHLCASMLYHAAPLDWATVSLHMGHRVVLVDKWEPQLLLQLIDAQQVTTTFMVPTMFVRMLKLPEETRRRYRGTSLRFVAHSAAPCPVETKRQMIEWWGPVIWESYGSSEGGGTIVNSEDWLKHPGTVGKPFAGSRFRVLDDAGEDVPPGVVGTIYLTRYTGDRFAYRGDPEKTRAAHRGEFFTVGDVGYLDEDGFLFLCDRKIDMIISAGMNIYSAEIERVLVQHPQVFDCAVFGIPDPIMGEAVKAVVQPQTGVQGDAALTVNILDFLGTRIAAAKLPRRVEYTGELPRDPNGKIYKRRLRDAHWSSLERKI